MSVALLQFSYLQVLDFLTTVAFVLVGVQEANPLVRMAFRLAPHPVSGLVMVKLLAFGLGYYCWRRGNQHLLQRMNLFFAALVVWNLCALIVTACLANKA